MVGHELAIEHTESGALHARDQPGERHFARIRHAAEHALPTKHSVEGDAVKTADEAIVSELVRLPAFEAVRMARMVERLIARFDAVADPAFGKGLARFRAGGDRGGEIPVAGDAKAILPDGLAQALGNMKLIERKDRPLARLHPEHFGIVPVIGHRKQASAIGGQQQFGGDHGRGGRRSWHNRCSSTATAWEPSQNLIAKDALAKQARAG